MTIDLRKIKAGMLNIFGCPIRHKNPDNIVKIWNVVEKRECGEVGFYSYNCKFCGKMMP